MQKIVINRCSGGFGLSEIAERKLLELGYPPNEDGCISEYSIPRDNALLVRAVEELGDRASGKCSKLVVVEIPDGVRWYIESTNSGVEIIRESHRVWGG